MFIGECLESVRAQECVPIEIMVGVDGCQATLDAVIPLMAAYPELRVLAFPKNNGPYVVRNTLAQRCTGDFLIFFDADDLMLPGLITWTIGHTDKAVAIRYLFRTEYIHAIGRCREICGRQGANGVFGIRRDSFERLGGFHAWPCSADSEFHLRCVKEFGPPVVSPRALFVYRKHAGCLTVKKATNSQSLTRVRYRAMVRRQRADGNFKTAITPTFGKAVEVLR